MKPHARLALVYDLRPDHAPRSGPPDLYAEFESMEHIEALHDVFESRGFATTFVNAHHNIIQVLQQLHGACDLVFNYSVGLHGRSREARLPALCDLLGLPYLGSDPMAHAIGANKHALKCIAMQLSLPTPRWAFVSDGPPPALPVARVIVKPVYEGSSMGLSAVLPANDLELIAAEVDRVRCDYGGAALVEEFVAGHDVTVPLVGTPLRAMPPVVLTEAGVHLDTDLMFTTEIKSSSSEGWSAVPAYFDVRTLSESAVAVARTVGCRDFGRVDFRVTPDGRPYLLELNTTPHLEPDRGPFAVSAILEGRSFAEAIDELVQTALGRYGYSQNHRSPIS